MSFITSHKEKTLYKSISPQLVLVEYEQESYILLLNTIKGQLVVEK